MEYFILGLLMLRKLTAYELHTIIKGNYQDICSDSIGNIQRALKKLYKKGLVTLEEINSGKVIKKIFSITPVGRAEFMTWLDNPIKISKAKNMELGRLLMLGFLTKEQQFANIDQVIQDLSEAYEYLKVIEATIKVQAEETGDVEQLQLVCFSEDQVYLKEFLDAVEADDFLEVLKSASKFSYLTLKYGIAEVKFNLEWFENLRKELENE